MLTATAASTPLWLLLALLLQRAGALSFNLTHFDPNKLDITYQGAAHPSGDGFIQLTKNKVESDLGWSWGRAVHSRPVHLWDSPMRNLTSFSTRFSFFVGNVPMRSPATRIPGDGLAFFLAPNGSSAPSNSVGGKLALFNVTPPSNATASIPTVAVEFDTHANTDWDPFEVHAGIDVNSIVSVVNVTWKGYGQWNNATGFAVVTYDAGTTNLSVSLSGDDGTYRSLYHLVDLREVLPEWVQIVFAATTGASVEIHKIKSWSFQSTLEDSTPSPPLPPPPTPPPQGNDRISGGWGWRVSLAGAAVPALIITLGSLFLPDTPNSLIDRGCNEEAHEMLCRVRGIDAVEAELRDLVAANQESRSV